MLTLDLEPELEMTLASAANREHISANELVKKLISRYLNQNNVREDDDALLIHEQLMNQYAETFERLAQ